MKKCCICGKPFEGFGNNPEPIKSSGRCCDECNENVVLPERLAIYFTGHYCNLNNSVEDPNQTDLDI